MNEATKKWKLESPDAKTVQKSDILEYLAFSYYSQEDLKKALYYTNQLLELVPDHPRAVGNKWYYEEALAGEGNGTKNLIKEREMMAQKILRRQNWLWITLRRSL